MLSKKLTVILRAKSHAGRTRPMHELDDDDFVHFVYFIDVVTDDDDFGLGWARACCVDAEVDILIIIRRIRAKPKKESKL